MSTWTETLRARREERRLKRARSRAERLLDLEGVSSVGIALAEDGTARIEVGVTGDVLEARARLPARVAGVSLIVRDVGRLDAHEQ